VTAATWLTSRGIEHHPDLDRGEHVRTFVCPRPGCGKAAKLSDRPDDSGEFWFECSCTASSANPGRRFSQQALARWLGVNGAAKARDEHRRRRSSVPTISVCLPEGLDPDQAQCICTDALVSLVKARGGGAR
jgi:hypothetical protein